MYNKLLIFLSVILCLASCVSVKPSTSKGASALFESFFVGEEGTQYFIKPMEFRNNKETLLVDFTFRYRNEVRDSVIVNFSILSENLIRNIDLLSINNQTNNILSTDINFLNSAVKGRVFTSRFTTKIHLSDLVKLFKSDSWEISVDSTTYKPIKRTKRSINRLNQNLFILMR